MMMGLSMVRKYWWEFDEVEKPNTKPDYVKRTKYEKRPKKKVGRPKHFTDTEANTLRCRRYRRRHVEQAREYERQYREKNREKLRAYQRDWYHRRLYGTYRKEKEAQ